MTRIRNGPTNEWRVRVRSSKRAAIIAAVPSKALEPFIGSMTVESAEFRLETSAEAETYRGTVLGGRGVVNNE